MKKKTDIQIRSDPDSNSNVEVSGESKDGSMDIDKAFDDDIGVLAFARILKDWHVFVDRRLRGCKGGKDI